MKFDFNKILLSLSLIVFLFQAAKSQEFIQNETEQKIEKKGFDKSKLFFGGGLGASFGIENIITLNPQVGYRFTEKFSTGVGFSYNYYSYNRYPKFSTNIYGGNVFSSYIIIDNFFLRAEYEILSVESQYITYLPSTNRINITSIFVGGGYKYPIGERSFINIMVLWNLNETQYSLYPNPLIRMNFEF